MATPKKNQASPETGEVEPIAVNAPEPEEEELLAPLEEVIKGLLWRAHEQGEYEEQISCRDDSAYELTNLHRRAIDIVNRAFDALKADEFPDFDGSNRLCVRIWVE